MSESGGSIVSFADKAAFVSGAASGIGLAISKALARAGARVMMTDVDAGKLEQIAQTVEGDVQFMACNVADYDDVTAVAERMQDTYGKIHLVFNNAGVNLGGSTGEIPLEDWRWVVDINFMGVVHGVEVFTPLIKRHGEGGHIVNTGSMASHWASPRAAPYVATKFAVIGLSEALRAELKDFNIGVSVLCPGWVATKLYETQLARPSGPENARIAAEDPAAIKLAEMLDRSLSPDRVADLTLNSILENRSHIFSAPEMRELIDRRRNILIKNYDSCLVDSALFGAI